MRQGRLSGDNQHQSMHDGIGKEGMKPDGWSHNNLYTHCGVTFNPMTIKIIIIITGSREKE